MSEKELLEYVSNNYEFMSLRQLARDTGCSRTKITNLMNKHNLKKRKYHLNEEVKGIILNNSHKSSEELSREIGVPASTIRRLWNSNGIKKKKYFNPNPIEFKNIYNKLKSSYKVAKEYGVSKSTVLKYAKKIGYDNKREPLLSNNQKDYVVDSYESKTSRELSEELGVSMSLIDKIWRSYGLKGKQRRVYSINENYFSTIDTKDKAYWLGWVASDGCVYCRDNVTYMTKITINKMDIKILELFNKYLKHDKPITIVGDTCSVEVISKTMFNDFAQYNITPNKTWSFRVPKLKKDLVSHFIRGYFDGDGSITSSDPMLPSSYGINISGQHKVLKDIKNLLKTFGINSTIIDDKRAYSDKFGSLVFKNTSEKYCFLKWLYNDIDNLYLKRKYDSAHNFVELVENNRTNRSTNTNAVKYFSNICRLW